MPGESPIDPKDLAPGDQRPLLIDPSDFQIVRVQSEKDPFFDQIYAHLWDAFGSKGEVEEKRVLANRLSWKQDPASFPREDTTSHKFPRCQYEMIGLFKQGKFVAARDHTVILLAPETEVSSQGTRNHYPTEAVVHLSHSLIAPEFRGKGLSGWLRAWPLHSAREALSAVPGTEFGPITLVAEMEPLDPLDQETRVRLKSYQRGAFLMVDPSFFDYQQPDFRPPAIIDQEGGPSALSLRLILRRVGREPERKMRATELNQTISAIYHMYSESFRKDDMRPVWKHFSDHFPKTQEWVTLVSPLQERDTSS